MCGFVGFLGYKHTFGGHPSGVLAKMSDALSHRGPDDEGIWFDDNAQVALAHRRLSILDLSVAGQQPMISRSGRFVIVYNGEIYNHLELRARIDEVASGMMDCTWRGHSDTESLLAGVECWGVEETLKKAVGMFAFALWDRERREITLARDRMGEKPLYYGWQNGVFLFGSELKALRLHPAFEGKINRDAITLQLRHNYIPAPHSIYHGINKLSPGCTLQINAKTVHVLTDPKPFWSLSEVVENGRVNPFIGDDQVATEELENILSTSVRGQMLSDVSLGAFLSGGIDSSMIVSLMQAQSSCPVKTFTIGFNEEGYNEAVHAKAVAEHLGTEHTELYVSPEEALGVIPKLPTLYDEPFSDSSQIPTFMVSEMTRRHVTVSLSGDGGDELFGGYNRYFQTQKWWNKIVRIPSPLRNLMVASLKLLGPKSWDNIGLLFSAITKNKMRWGNFGNQINKLSGVLSVNDGSALYKHFISHWPDPDRLVIGATELPSQVSNPALEIDSIVEQMMFLDSLSYLPDDILCKVDRASMGVSLETRVPMLDHRVVEFAWSLPLSKKIHNNQGKTILRNILYKYVPKSLIERPKMGFGVPIDSWLRGPLRDWAENLLDESRLSQEGFFEPGPIREKWSEHLSGRRNWQYHLWDILMFQAWLRNESE